MGIIVSRRRPMSVAMIVGTFAASVTAAVDTAGAWQSTTAAAATATTEKMAPSSTAVGTAYEGGRESGSG